jgi:hypothetical protein
MLHKIQVPEHYFRFLNSRSQAAKARAIIIATAIGIGIATAIISRSSRDSSLAAEFENGILSDREVAFLWGIGNSFV